MFLWLLRRLFQAALSIAIMALITFVGIFAIGDPVDILINPEANQQEIDTVRRAFGLDQSIFEQFIAFIGNAVHGDLGRSFVFGTSAVDLILDRLPATLELSLVALALAIVIGIPLGVIAGLNPHTFTGRAIMASSIAGFSLPNFWQGVMLILLFSVLLGWFPAGGRGETASLFGIQVSFLTWNGMQHLILPALNLALFKIALVIRLASAGTREVMLQDYIKFAVAKGISRFRIIAVHLLKNILIPVVTVIGLEFGSMIAFSVVTESVFSWPGMGKLLIDSINVLDRPVVVAYLMMTVLIFVVINFIVDVLYTLLDPRVRLAGAKE